ncbi:CBS domain-containing protein, partial [uncultured Thermus sp.]|uniref:CBS domain-containing protein n=1 Tax=uncultured Thermus sp. TaxID=157149 RepID=UPI00260D32DA
MDLLTKIPPLDRLPPEELRRISQAGHELLLDPGTPLLEQGGSPADKLYLLLEGKVALLDGEKEVGTLGAGEFFGFPSLLSGEPPALGVVAKTPVRLLAFPTEAFQRLLTYPEAARFFGQGLAERVRLRLAPEPSLFAPVGNLVRRPPAFIPPSATVEEAARRMRQEGISSLLVEGEPLGILTDRDLRNRVLAEGLSPSTPVAQVMTTPLFTLPAETPIYEALAAMVERGIHHLPLTEGGKVVGVVTHTDLLLNQAQSPLVLLRRIERLELSRYG